MCFLTSVYLPLATRLPRIRRRTCGRVNFKIHKVRPRNSETTEIRRLNDSIQTSEYYHTPKATFHTLNRRLDTVLSDVCFSVKTHWILAGRDSDVWTRLIQTSVPVAELFLPLCPVSDVWFGWFRRLNPGYFVLFSLGARGLPGSARGGLLYSYALSSWGRNTVGPCTILFNQFW